MLATATFAKMQFLNEKVKLHRVVTIPINYFSLELCKVLTFLCQDFFGLPLAS